MSGNSTEVNQWVERLLLRPLSRMLYDIRSGLIMGTADTPDPHLDPYNHNALNMWADVATDLTNADITETAFGFTLDEIHQLERELQVHSIDAELTPYYFGQATVYSMAQVLDEVRRQGGDTNDSAKLLGEGSVVEGEPNYNIQGSV